MKYIKDFLSILSVLVKQRYLIFQLSKRDFQNKYLASYIGLPWAFIQPGVTILIMWFVFTRGFKVGSADANIPFAPWLICGMVPWFFISETITGTTNSLIEYSYLIKKIYFRASIIPLIKIFTALIIHGFFILLMTGFAISNEYTPNVYWIQIFYYLLATIILLTGIGWLTSSMTVFVRDVGQFVNVTVQILFWATPIFWQYSKLEGNWRLIVYLNPFFYIINGYRETFFGKVWFWEHLRSTLYFWGLTAFIIILGALIFKRLRPHFADVL